MERFNILKNIARFAEILGKTEDPLNVHVSKSCSVWKR
jgi:hypothetical protein